MSPKKGPFWTEPPFAIFVISDKVSLATVNARLTDAFDGSNNGGPGKTWVFYLVDSTDYSRVPRERTRFGDYTEAPIPDSFKSPFTGSEDREAGIKKAADWLESSPESNLLDRNHFVVLDELSGGQGEGLMTVAKIGDKELEGKDVRYMEIKAWSAGLFLKGMEYGTWEEQADNGNNKSEDHLIKR